MKNIYIYVFTVLSALSAHAEIPSSEFCNQAANVSNQKIALMFNAPQWDAIKSYSLTTSGTLGDFFLGMPDTNGDGNPDQVDIDGNRKTDDKDQTTRGESRYTYERNNTGFVYYGLLQDLPYEYTVHKDYGKYVSTIKGFGPINEKIVNDEAEMQVSKTTGQAYVPYISHAKGWDIFKYEKATKDWSMTKGVDWQPMSPGEAYIFNYSEAFYVIDDQEYHEVTQENMSDLITKYQLEKIAEQYDWENKLPQSDTLPKCK